jgi:hypothetical protein
MREVPLSSIAYLQHRVISQSSLSPSFSTRVQTTATTAEVNPLELLGRPSEVG